MKIVTSFSLIVLLTVSMGVSSCKSSKSATSTTAAKTVMADNYRLIIAFISKGGGTDGKAQETIEKFITDHAKKPALEKYRWGREGEVDFCLKLNELSTKEQKNFVEEVKKLAGKSDLVQISENAPCVHKK